MENNPPSDLNKKKKQLSGYARYSAIAMQMIAIIIIGVLGGIELDKRMELKFPVFTMSLTLLSVFLAIYFVIKDLIKKK